MAASYQLYLYESVAERTFVTQNPEGSRVFDQGSSKQLYDTLSSSFGYASYIALQGLNQALPIRPGITVAPKICAKCGATEDQQTEQHGTWEPGISKISCV